MTLSRAISTHVCHDDAVVLGACLEACIPFAAAHELIRQQFRGLNLIAPISDMSTDMLIGAGCVGQVTGAWVGNVSGGLGHNYRRSVEQGVPHQVNVHDHSNFSLGMALSAGAYGIPFIPVRSLLGSDLLRSNSTFQVQEDEESATSYVRVPSLNPDVALLSLEINKSVFTSSESDAFCEIDRPKPVMIKGVKRLKSNGLQFKIIA